MKRHFSFCLLMIFCIVWLPVFAYSTDKDQMIQDLVEKSGIQEQVRQIPLSLLYSLRQNMQLKQLPENYIKPIENEISEAFDPQIILRTIEQRFHENLSHKEIEKTLVWLNSSLGMKITELEKESAKPGAMKDGASDMQALLNDPAAVERLKYIQRIEKATRTTDITTDMVLNMQISVILALNSLAPPEQQKSYEEVTAFVNTQRNAVKEALSQQAISSFLYTYRDLVDAELEQYITFIESDAGRKYHDISLKALSEALVAASQKYAEYLGTLAGERDAQKPSKI